MVDNKPEHNAAPPDSSQPDIDAPASGQHDVDQNGAPPVIDLPASEFSEAAGPTSTPERPRASLLSATALPALSGAVAAAIVVAAAWIAAVPLLEPSPPPIVDNKVIDALTARVAGVESKAAAAAAPATDPAIPQRLETLEKTLAALRDSVTARPAAADPAIAGRIDALEKSVEAIRSDLAAAVGRSKQAEGAITAQKTAAADAASSEIAAITERLNQIERAPKLAPLDDAPLRRLVAATLLDLSVNRGEPYAAALDAARAGASDANGLKALETFAASGVPSAASLSRDLIALLPQLSPAAGTSGSPPGLLDRLQAGAEGLIKIQRPDGVPGSDRAAIVSRVAAAAQRNEVATAKRELEALSPAERAPAQLWIQKVEARDTALAASRQLASAALAALPKSTQ